MRTLFDARIRQDVLDRLDRLQADSPRQWGRMTAGQALCHLSDAFHLVMGQAQTEFRADGLFNRTVGRLFALSLPVPWPKGVPTSPEADAFKDGTPPGDFADDAARLRDDVERFVARDGRDLPPHPALGRLTRAEWGRWGYRHMDHHLRQFGV